MRTTVEIADDLLKDAKQVANRTGRTLGAVIEDALRLALARGHQPVKRRRVRIPTFKGEGLQPGVDLDDSAALEDLLEEGHAPR